MPHSYHMETTHQLGRAVHGDPEWQENRRIWYLGGHYLFYLFTYLFETWYVSQDGHKFPDAHLPAPAPSAYAEGIYQHTQPYLLVLILLLEGLHPRYEYEG